MLTHFLQNMTTFNCDFYRLLAAMPHCQRLRCSAGMWDRKLEFGYCGISTNNGNSSNCTYAIKGADQAVCKSASFVSKTAVLISCSPGAPCTSAF